MDERGRPRTSSTGLVLALGATVTLWALVVVAAGATWWALGRGPASVLTQPTVTLVPAPAAAPVPPVAPPGPGAVVAVPPAGTAGLSRARLDPAQGHLDELLGAHVRAAEASRRHLAVFFTASWCAPCQAAHRTLAASDVALRLADVHLVEIDVDAFTRVEMHRAEALLLGREVDAIPLFCALRSAEPAVCVDGGAWGEDTDSNIRSVLLPFLAEPPSGLSPRRPDSIVPI